MSETQISSNQITDPLASRIIRPIFVAEIVILPLILILLAIHLASLASLLGLIAFILFSGILAWLYKRYNSHPLIQEKKSLGAQVQQAQSQLTTQEQNIQAAQNKRRSFPTLESEELKAALQSLQKDYIRSHLKHVLIADAKIPGIGPKLKVTLLFHKIITAADIDSRISTIDGFGQAKSQALLDWRDSIFAQFDQTKPTALPVEQINSIQQQFQNRIRSNDEAEQNAVKTKSELEQKKKALQTRIKELAPLTFLSYIVHAIAPNKIVAGLATALLVIFQLCACFTASVGAISASVPTLTHTPTVDIVALQTKIAKTYIAQLTQSAPTNTSTLTATITITNTPTLTETAGPTNTLVPTQTPYPTATTYYASPVPTYPPGATALCNDGTYSFTQHRRGSCSGHGGVAQWLATLPP